MSVVKLRSTIAGDPIYAKVAEYDSEGNKISSSLESKQDVISDIEEIRSGAAAGAAAYQKPNTGIPSSDMTSEVQTSLGKADSAIQHVYAGTDELIPDNTRTVTIPYAEVIPAHTVTIGGRSYKTVTMPDGNEWLAENLDYEWDNLPIGASGAPSTPAGWYYNNQKNDYGIDGTYKCGLLYNWHAVEYLNNNKDTLIPGWHVATTAEWEALFAASGGWAAAGTRLKARNNSITGAFPNNWNGTDEYEFAVLPGGYRGEAYSEHFESFGRWASYWTGTEQSSTRSYYVTFGDSANPGESYTYKTDAYYVRLVKDSPTGTGPVYKSGLMTSSMVKKVDTAIQQVFADQSELVPVDNKVTIPVFTGSDPGLVPSATSADADKALRGDGTWGDVSSVSVSYDSVNEELHLDFSAGGN